MAVSSRATSSGSNTRMSVFRGRASSATAHPAPPAVTASSTHPDRRTPATYRCRGRPASPPCRLSCCRRQWPGAARRGCRDVRRRRRQLRPPGQSGAAGGLPASPGAGRGPPGGGLPLRRAAAAPDRGRLGGPAGRARPGARPVPDRRRGRRRLRAHRPAGRARVAGRAAAVGGRAARPGHRGRAAVPYRAALGPVAEVALAAGVPGLREFRLQVGRPLQPMLASTAPSVEAAMKRVGEAAVEWKLDGARVQVHRAGTEVAVFTRTLDDITARVPEVVAAALALPASAAVLDGEVIALQPDGRPHPFQVTASRVGSRLEVARLAASLPLTVFLFDLLHLDGQDLLDRTGAERHAAMAAVVPETLRIPRTVTADPAAAAAFLDDTLARGHEGVMVKSLAATWEAGRRGAGWLKVKPVHTLDLVVLAAEWGHGRRRGWLSNLHLGARDPSGGFVMLGKTFKGMTDKLLTWQTERLLELEVSRDAYTVHVRPELVVEIAFDGLQTSPRYPGGLALRFARVVRYRPDKRPEEADTIATVRAIHAGG